MTSTATDYRRFSVVLRHSLTSCGDRTPLCEVKVSFNGTKFRLTWPEPNWSDAHLDDKTLLALPAIVRERVRSYMAEGGRWNGHWDAENGIETEIKEL